MNDDQNCQKSTEIERYNKTAIKNVMFKFDRLFSMSGRFQTSSNCILKIRCSIYEKWDASESGLNIFSSSFDIGFGFSISDLRSVEGFRASEDKHGLGINLHTVGNFWQIHRTLNSSTIWHLRRKSSSCESLEP